MIKNGAVRIGKTPTAESGQPATQVRKGEAAREDEKKPKTLDRLRKGIPVEEQ